MFISGLVILEYFKFNLFFIITYIIYIYIYIIYVYIRGRPSSGFTDARLDQTLADTD